MADPNLLRYMGEVSIEQMKLYYEPLITKLKEQAEAIKDNRGVNGLSYCIFCFCVGKNIPYCAGCYKRVCRFCMPKCGLCTECSVPCSATKCTTRLDGSKTLTKCTTCREVICDEHIEYCRDCGAVLCFEKDVCVGAHECVKVYKREKRRKIKKEKG